jgi:hypothetical protein
MESAEFFARRLLLQGRGVFGHAVRNGSDLPRLDNHNCTFCQDSNNVIRVSFAVQK